MTERNHEPGRGPRAGEPSGSFLARVAGDMGFEMRGRATFDRRPNTEDGRWVFLVVLTHESAEGDGRHVLTFSNATSQPIALGEYSLGEMGPRGFVGIYSHVTEGGACGDYPADGGALEILEFRPDLVRGRFRFRGSGFNNFDLLAVEGMITAEGEFAAVIDPEAFDMAFPPAGE